MSSFSFKKSGALGHHSHRVTTGTEEWLPSLDGRSLSIPGALCTCLTYCTTCLAIWVWYLCSAHMLFRVFLINFIELSHKCNFPVRQNDRCFPLIGSSRCQNLVLVVFLIFMQNFAGLFFIVLQESLFSCSHSGNMMRSALLKCSVKCPEKLLTVTVTATSPPGIVLMAIRC